MENDWKKILAEEQKEREIKINKQQEFLNKLKTIVENFDNSNISNVTKTILELQQLLQNYPRNIEEC